MIAHTITRTCVRCDINFDYEYVGGAMRKLCSDCVALRANKNNRDRNAARRAAGLCPRCGSEGPFGFVEVTKRRKTYCEDCNLRNSDQQQKFRDEFPDIAAARSAESSANYREHSPDLSALSNKLSTKKRMDKMTDDERKAYHREQWERYKMKKISQGEWDAILDAKRAYAKAHPRPKKPLTSLQAKKRRDYQRDYQKRRLQKLKQTPGAYAVYRREQNAWKSNRIKRMKVEDPAAYKEYQKKRRANEKKNRK